MHKYRVRWMKNKLILVSSVIENRNSLSFPSVTTLQRYHDMTKLLVSLATTPCKANLIGCQKALRSCWASTLHTAHASTSRWSCSYTNTWRNNSLYSTLEANILWGYLKKLFTDEYSRHCSVFRLRQTHFFVPALKTTLALFCSSYIYTYRHHSDPEGST